MLLGFSSLFRCGFGRVVVEEAWGLSGILDGVGAEFESCSGFWA